MHYVGEGRTDEITLDLYGGRDGRFMFYEDDGTTNAYENGAFSLIPISFTEDEHGCAITLGQITGDYKAFTGNRTFKVRYHMPGDVVEADINYTGDRFVRYQMVLK